MNHVNVAVIGFGHLGQWHAEKVEQSSHAKLKFIIEPFEQNALKAKEKFPHVKVIADYQQIIDEVDAFIVVTPTSTHYSISRNLLEKNKHVFCEKPICATMEEAKKLFQLYQQQPQPVFQVGHSERCHQIWQDFQVPTAPYLIRILRAGVFKNRALDVPVTSDLAIHDIDLIHYLTRSRVKSVQAFAVKSRGKEYDTVSIHGDLDNEARFEIFCTRDSLIERRQWEIFHHKGTEYIDLMTCQRQSTTGDSDSYQKRDHLALQQDSFYQSILSGQDVYVSMREAIDALAVIEAIHGSIEKQSSQRVNY